MTKSEQARLWPWRARVRRRLPCGGTHIGLGGRSKITVRVLSHGAPLCNVSGGSSLGFGTGAFAVAKIFATVIACTFLMACGGGPTGPTTPTSPALSASMRTFFTFTGETGSWVADGQVFEYTSDNASFRVYGTSNVVNPGTNVATNDPSRVHVEINPPNAFNPALWSLDLEAPQGERLLLKTYTSTKRFAAPGVPGLQFLGGGRGCGESIGSFRVVTLEYGGPRRGNENPVPAFRAVFDQQCNDTHLATHLRGEVQIVP